MSISKIGDLVIYPGLEHFSSKLRSYSTKNHLLDISNEKNFVGIRKQIARSYIIHLAKLLYSVQNGNERLH